MTAIGRNCLLSYQQWKPFQKPADKWSILRTKKELNWFSLLCETSQKSDEKGIWKNIIIKRKREKKIFWQFDAVAYAVVVVIAAWFDFNYGPELMNEKQIKVFNVLIKIDLQKLSSDGSILTRLLLPLSVIFKFFNRAVRRAVKLFVSNLIKSVKFVQFNGLLWNQCNDRIAVNCAARENNLTWPHQSTPFRFLEKFCFPSPTCQIFADQAEWSCCLQRLDACSKGKCFRTEIDWRLQI